MKLVHDQEEITKEDAQFSVGKKNRSKNHKLKTKQKTQNVERCRFERKENAKRCSSMNSSREIFVYISDQLLSEIGGHCGLYLGLSIASLVRIGIELFRISNFLD